jgi:hypothetical protein
LRIERGSVGRLFFRYSASPRRLLGLQSPTGVYAIARQAHDVTVGQPGLERILDSVRKIPIDTVRRIARACDDAADGSRVELAVTLHGAHRFTAADVRTGAETILRQTHTTRPVTEGPALRLAVNVRKRRALITVLLGPRRPQGDPQREGWSGPAAACVARLLDLGEEHSYIAMPNGQPGTVHLHTIAGAATLTANRGRLPVRDASVVAFLVASERTAGLESMLPQLAEAARAVVAGGVVALLVPAAAELGPQLQQAGLPLEPLGGVPFYVRRQRWGLFLLERVELIQLDEALSPS